MIDIYYYKTYSCNCPKCNMITLHDYFKDYSVNKKFKSCALCGYKTEIKFKLKP